MAAPRFITLVNGTKTEEVSVTTSTPDSIPALDGSGLLNTNMLPGVSVDKGGTGLTSVPDASVLVSNATNVFSALVVGASQSIQRNPENTAWVAFTPGSGGGPGASPRFPSPARMVFRVRWPMPPQRPKLR